VLRKLLAADEFHRSRLHDEKGNRLPASELRHVPRNAYYVARRKLTGKLPELPWVTYNAIRRLDALLDPSWRMIEFGSGMSTAWYARRVKSLHSIEDDPEWFARLSGTLPPEVRYELRGPPAYWDLSDYEDASVDCAVVDGVARAECVEAVLPKIRPGGWLYLDNSDKDMTRPDGDLRRAEAALRQAVDERQGSLEQATGLTVGLLLAHQWQLARL
jgi:hypothetical protein